MYEALLPRVLDLIIPDASGVRVSGKELSDFALHLARSGFAVGINRAGGAGPPGCFGLVIRGGAKPPIRMLADRLLRAAPARELAAAIFKSLVERFISTTAPLASESSRSGPRARTWSSAWWRLRVRI